MNHAGGADADGAQMVRRCRERLSVALPGRPRTLAMTRAALEQQRGRSIQVVVGDPGELILPSGLWLQLAERDVVWVDRRTSPMHQVVIVGHEFGHMICGHEPEPVDGAGLTGPLPAFADQQLGLSAAHITAIMGRCGDVTRWLGRERDHNEPHEREAEITGRLLAEQLLAALGPGLSELWDER